MVLGPYMVNDWPSRWRCNGVLGTTRAPAYPQRQYAHTGANSAIWVIRSQAWWKKVAIFLIIAGIAGEGVCEFLGAKAETAVRNFDETVAGDAAKNADRARCSADKADAAARDAQKRVEAVRKRAAAIDLSLSMTQYRMIGRGVYDHDSLTKQLMPFKGQTIVFRSYANDSDGYFLCEEILSAAQSAKMVTDDHCGIWPYKGADDPALGITVSGGSDADAWLALERIMSQFSPFAGAVAIPAKHPSAFVVFVGRSEPFNLGQVRPTSNALPAKRKSRPTRNP
jgi:hypothetical protein